MKDTSNPGSDEAIKQGCTCPVVDNRYGKGLKMGGRTSFWFDDSCPLHVISKLEKEDINNPTL